MPKVIITGSNGFVGKHVVRAFVEKQWDVVGVGQSEYPDEDTKDLLEKYYACDLTDKAQVDQISLDSVDAVVSLAALANVGKSFDDPEAYKKANVDVFSILSKRILNARLKIRVIAVSSGSVYDPSQPMPLTEDSKLIISGSPYSMSKLLMEKAALELSGKGLDCVIARPFNHSGPEHPRGFLIPDLYHKILESKETGQPIPVGNLETKRDYTDVRDIAKAYIDLVEAENLQFGIYNICSGTSVKSAEILEMLLTTLKLKDSVETIIDSSLIRPVDPPDLRGSSVRIQKETGWRPEIPLTKTIQDFVSYEQSK